MSSLLRSMTAGFLLLLSISVAVPAAASAGSWTGYAASITPEGLVPFDTATGETGEPIEFFNSPRALTISPDGTTAYVLAFNPTRVIPVDLATRVEGEAMPMPGVSKIALTPAGDAIYGAAINAGEIYRLDLATGHVDDPIEVGAQPWDLAITPDGSSIYVTTGSYPTFPASWAGVARIDLATDTVTKVGETGSSMQGIGVLPDGSSVYAIAQGLNRAYQVQGDAIVSYFSAGFQAGDIAISPDGTKALVTNFSQDAVTVLDLENNTTGIQIPVGDYPSGIAFAPDSSKAFVTNSESEDITPIDMDTLTAEPPIPSVGRVRAIAVTPDQPPTAAFTATTAESGQETTFDGSASKDGDGPITSYAWDFGDGATTTTSSPIINHRYAAAGRYTARLTVTSGFECPRDSVFTGQISSCRRGDRTSQLQVEVTPKRSFCELNPKAPQCVSGGGGGGGVVRPAKLGRLEVRPKRLKMKRRKAAVIRVKVRNIGGTATKSLRVCVKAPKRLIKPNRRCLTRKSLASGRTATLKFRLRAGKQAKKGRRAKVTFIAKTPGLSAKKAGVTIRFR